MKKRMKALAALLCVTAMVTGCGSGASDSGTSSAKTQTQKEEGSAKTDESQEKKSEVTIGFSSEGNSFDPCTGFGYTGSPLYSNLVKVNGDDQLENDLACIYMVAICFRYTRVSEGILKCRYIEVH